MYDSLQEWKKAAGAMIQGESPLPAAAQPLLHPLHTQLEPASLTNTPRFVSKPLLRFVSKLLLRFVSKLLLRFVSYKLTAGVDVHVLDPASPPH